MNTAFIFPAFIADYTEKEVGFLVRNGIDINAYIQNVSGVLELDLPLFSYNSIEYKQDELLSQIIAYLFACAISDALRSQSIKPNFVSGYSMGIYAALYAAKSVTIEDGANLIVNAFKIVEEVTKTGEYGMAAVIGLSVGDIVQLISANNLDAEIININNKHSIVIAGVKKHIKLFLILAQKEGAMSVSELTVNTPYHSKYLLNYSKKFENFVQSVNINKAEIPIVSTYNQRLCIGSEDIKLDLVHNLTEKIHWYKTMQKLIELDASCFYECGAGKDLKKIARFIDGDYKIKSIYKL